MTDEERKRRIAAIQARRASRGASDPLNRLQAYITQQVAQGATVYINQPVNEE